MDRGGREGEVEGREREIHGEGREGLRGSGWRGKRVKGEREWMEGKERER